MVSEAKGATIEDADGNRFLDFSESVSSVGHCNPCVVDSVRKQAETFMHSPGVVGYGESFVELAELLKCLLPMDRKGSKIAFCVSGTEACDHAMTIVRKHMKRPIILAFHDAFHGLTHSTAGITTQARQSGAFTIADTAYIPYPNCFRCTLNLQYPECSLSCLNHLRTVFESVSPPSSVAAVFVEPIQVHGGVIVPPKDYFSQLGKICKEYEIALVDDEVYTGFGKTGRFFAIEHWNLEPDIITMGKAMGAGLPIGAIACKDNFLESCVEGRGKFGTMAGNPVATVASIAGIRFIQDNGLLVNAARIGEYLVKAVGDMKYECRFIGDVRGKGLLVGIELVQDDVKTPSTEKTRLVVRRARELGLIVSRVGRYHNVVELCPPLTVTIDEAVKAVDILQIALKETV
jgi:4-aminobutyrate aminotransferase-like enzyme